MFKSQFKPETIFKENKLSTNSNFVTALNNSVSTLKSLDMTSKLKALWYLVSNPKMLWNACASLRKNSQFTSVSTIVSSLVKLCLAFPTLIIQNSKRLSLKLNFLTSSTVCIPR